MSTLLQPESPAERRPEAAELSPQIAALLARLRRGIRAYVWLEGIAAVVATIGLLFWLGLLIDWIAEPSTPVRIAGLALAALAIGYVVYRTILARAFARLSDTSMAILLEKHSNRFHDGLLTSVELGSATDRPEIFNREMLAHTSREAAEQASTVRLRDVFNPRPLLRKSLAAVALAGSIGLFAFFSSETFGFYLDRLQLSPERWPRRTRLVVEGFPENEAGIRLMKVAKGTNLELTIKADNGEQYEVPRRVEVLYSLDDGSRGRGDSRRIGNAVPGKDPWQEYQFTFENVHQSQTFEVVGRDEHVPLGLRDERIRGLRLEVVESPAVFKKVLHLDYPQYMGRSPAAPEATSTMQIPRGTKVLIRATANKDLVKVQVFDSTLPDPVTIDMPAGAADSARRREFEYAIPVLDGDRVLQFALTDTDGIETPERERDRLSLVAVADEPPQVTVRLKGIGEAITPQANVPVAGTIADDHGLGRVWFEHRVNDLDPRQTPLAAIPAGRQSAPVEQPLDVRPLALAPRQAFTLWVKASDRHDLDAGPNEGSSTRFELKVVTPDDLRSILERDELRLRQRFEAVYGEMVRTRDLLARVDFAPPGEKKPDAKKSADGADASTAESDDAEDAAADGQPADPERLANRRKLQVLKALHYVERAGHDVLSVAAGFDDIHEQHVNNRMDTEEIKQRLQDDIASPLRNIGGPLLKNLTERMTKLQQLAADVQAGPVELRGAIAQADLVLVEMKQVLDRMKEIGDFNEVVEMLRALIRDQEQVGARVKERRKQQTLKILEEDE